MVFTNFPLDHSFAWVKCEGKYCKKFGKMVIIYAVCSKLCASMADSLAFTTFP